MASSAGGKNRKFGRHSRNPSSKNQAARTQKNKERRAKKFGTPLGVIPDYHDGIKHKAYVFGSK